MFFTTLFSVELGVDGWAAIKDSFHVIPPNRSFLKPNKLIKLHVTFVAELYTLILNIIRIIKKIFAGTDKRQVMMVKLDVLIVFSCGFIDLTRHDALFI